jgi:hypothetical protein
MFSFASALMHCGEHSEANTCAETVLLNDPANVKVNLQYTVNKMCRSGEIFYLFDSHFYSIQYTASMDK